MAAKHHCHIALTRPLAEYVDAQIAGGEYASASEMIRAALRLLMERDRAAVRLNLAPIQTPQADE
jgi:antitoxin ParD1/3/4